MPRNVERDRIRHTAHVLVPPQIAESSRIVSPGLFSERNGHGGERRAEEKRTRMSALHGAIVNDCMPGAAGFVEELVAWRPRRDSRCW